jgi:hypothetical protein
MQKTSIHIVVILMVSLCLLEGCGLISIQPKQLYDYTIIDTLGIDGFKAVDIFKDEMDKSFWVSKETECVTVQPEKKIIYADQGSIHIKWDKVTGGCKWIGCGFGWNNWVAKNMSDLTDIAAVQMQVKSAKGSFTNLPVAFAFEDYNGVQAYYGFNKTLVNSVFNDSTWTSVTIPLTKFDFENKNFNTESVKQFMIQLEGDGDIYLDNIKIVRL